MINVSGYQNSVSGYYGNDISKPKATAESTRTKETGSTKDVAKGNEAKLSAKAQDFLKNLREANDDMDFFVGDSEDDVQGALKESDKEFSVVFSAEELEKMADDEEYAQSKLNSVTKAMEMSYSISEQYNFEGNGIKAKIGISFDENGNTQIFAELEKIADKQKERIEEQRKARSEEKAKDAKEAADKKKLERYGKKEDAPTVKRTTLTADDEDSLIEQLQNLDWSKITEERPYVAGERIDFAV